MESDEPSQLQAQPTVSSIDTPTPIPMDEDDIVLPFISLESLPRTPTRLSTPPPRDGPVTSTPVRDGLPFHMYQHQQQIHSAPNTPTRPRPGHRYSASYSFPTTSSTPFSAAPGGMMGMSGMGRDRGVEGDGTFIPTHSRYANSSFHISKNGNPTVDPIYNSTQQLLTMRPPSNGSQQLTTAAKPMPTATLL